MSTDVSILLWPSLLVVFSFWNGLEEHDQILYTYPFLHSNHVVMQIWDFNSCRSFNMNHKPFNAKQEDVELIAKLGFDAYRFSISWSRIFPGMLPFGIFHGVLSNGKKSRI